MKQYYRNAYRGLALSPIYGFEILYQLPCEDCPGDLPGEYFWFFDLPGKHFWFFDLPGEYFWFFDLSGGFARWLFLNIRPVRLIILIFDLPGVFADTGCDFSGTKKSKISTEFDFINKKQIKAVAFEHNKRQIILSFKVKPLSFSPIDVVFPLYLVSQFS